MVGSMTYIGIILALWLVFVVTWAIAAIGVKRDIRQRTWWRRAFAWRIGLLVIVLLLGRSSSLDRLSRYRRSFRIVPSTPIIALIGVILCATGIAFAIWARWHLGRNWSAIPSLKEGHELVTSGPYAYVRHPIYTGILTALLGSALTLGGAALIAFVACCGVFIWRVKVEEQLMLHQFPNDYPAYRARTKALIPFVF
jgi:protein-S-isoprenylcysteine O-methyltransferase Ste14